MSEEEKGQDQEQQEGADEGAKVEQNIHVDGDAKIEAPESPDDESGADDDSEEDA